MTIGIALSAARLPTIFPQAYDIPFDLILTEDGVAATRPKSRTDR
jgi:5-formyltetrahydrofolate cyclo-ligase